MGLSYDVVKIILEIKYQNWCNLKRCVCGGDDFKTCSPFECVDCENAYCNNQNGIKEWVWECSNCWGYYCGEHEFKMDRIGKRICFYCMDRIGKSIRFSCISPEDYKINEKFEKKKLTGVQIDLWKKHYYAKRRVWRDDIIEI